MRIATPLTAIAFCLFVNSAHAQTDSTSAGPSSSQDLELARALRKQGMSLQDHGDYEGARQAYLTALKYEPRPAVFANLALVEMGLKRYRDAAEHCSVAIRQMPTDAPTTDVTLLKTKCTEAKSHVGAIGIAVEKSGAEVFVNGNPVGTSPLIDPCFVEPGHVTVAARIGDQRSPTYALDVEQGTVLRLNVAVPDLPPVRKQDPPPASGTTLSPRPQPPVTSTPPTDQAGSSSSNILVPSLIGGGLALTGLALGIAFGSKSSSSEDEARRLTSSLQGREPCANQAPPGFSSACASSRNAFSDAQTFRSVSIAGYVGGGVALAGTLAYVLLARPKSTRTSLTPVIGPTQAQITFQSEF